MCYVVRAIMQKGIIYRFGIVYKTFFMIVRSLWVVVEFVIEVVRYNWMFIYYLLTDNKHCLTIILLKVTN